jgi:hypothetical protein
MAPKQRIPIKFCIDDFSLEKRHVLDIVSKITYSNHWHRFGCPTLAIFVMQKFVRQLRHRETGIFAGQAVDSAFEHAWSRLCMEHASAYFQNIL